MAKRDVLKTYSIEISAVTDKASTQIDQLEKELDSLAKSKGLSAGIQSQIDSMTKSLDGLKGEIKSSTTKINQTLETIKTDKMAEQFSQMEDSISKSIKEVQDKMTELQGTMNLLSDPKNTKGLTSGFSNAFKELESTIDNALSKFSNVSSVMQGILDGSFDTKVFDKTEKKIKSSTENVNSSVTKLKNQLKKSVKEIRTIMDDYTLDDLFDGAGIGSEEAYKAIEIINDILDVSKKLKNENIDISELLSVDGIKTSQKTLEAYRRQLNRLLTDRENEVKKQRKKSDVPTEVRFRYIIEDPNNSAIDSIVNKIKTDVIDKVQEKLDSTPIKIPIGYTYDRNIMQGDQKALDAAEGKDVDKVILKHINLDVKANTSTIVNQINNEVKRVNDELKTSGKKIEVEVIGKINESTIGQSAQEIVEEIEDVQIQRQNGYTIKGGQLTIDPSSGIATESTLKDIRNIISQWNSTGIPGTQSKEFKEQIKVEKENQKYYSDFEKRVRTGRQSSILTKQERSQAETRDMLLATIRLEDIAREEINKLVRNTDLKKGDKSVLEKSDFYSKSFEVDGIKYATFGDGETLEAWQKKWDAVFENTFTTAENYNKNLGKLFDTTEKIDGKTKIVEKGQLKLRREAINKRQKSQRETLTNLGIEFRKNEKGSYDHESILAERHVITGTEDAYAKVYTIVKDIKLAAQQEYDIRMQEIAGLEEQKAIMLEIHSLEEKSKTSDFTVEDSERLDYLKQTLSSQIKIIDNEKEYDKLLEEKTRLRKKSLTSSLSKTEHERLLNIDNDIETLFVEVDDLSGHIVKQITATTEDGLSPIDKQIQYLRGQVDDFVKGIKKEIGLVYQPLKTESLDKVAADRKKGRTEKAQKSFSRSEIERYRINVPITTDERYEWNKKEIERLKTENGRLGKLIYQDKNNKTRYDLMTPYESSKFWNNTKIINALKTQNLLYEEQKGLVNDLNSGYDYLTKNYETTSKALDLSGTTEQKYNQILARRAKDALEAKEYGRTAINDESFIHNLSDTEFAEVSNVFKELENTIKTQSGLTSIQIRGLVESQIQEDIDYFKDELKATEKLLLDMEKNPNKYSTREKRNADEKRIQLENSISQLENKENVSNKFLVEKRELLKGINTEQEGLVQNLKEKLGLNDEDIEDIVKLYNLQKKMNQESSLLKDKNIQAWNYFVPNPKKLESEKGIADSIDWDHKLNSWEHEEFNKEVKAQVQAYHSARAAFEEFESMLKSQHPELLAIANQNKIDSGLLLDAILDSEERREKVIDEIMKIKAHQNGMSVKKYRTDVLGVSSVGGMKIGTGIGGKAFDPFDTTGEDKNLYDERVNFYTQQLLNKDNSRASTVKQMLEVIQKEALIREENAKKAEEQVKAAKESFEIEKKSLKNKQKDTVFTDKKYNAKKAEIELSYKQQQTEQELFKNQLLKEKESLQAEVKRTKNGKIAKNDTSINSNIARIIERVTGKEEYAYFLAMQKENEISEARNQRIAKILAKKNELKAYQDDKEWERISPKLKSLERLDGESDSEYNKRSNLDNRRQNLILSKQEAINKAEEEHKQLLKAENTELDKINKKKDKLLSSIQIDTSLTKDTMSSLVKSYLEKEKLYLDLKKESSLVGTTGTDKLYSEEEKKDLQIRLSNATEEFQNIKQQFIKEFLSYVVNNTISDSDKQLSNIYQNIMSEKMLSEQSEAYELMSQRDSQIAKIDNNLVVTEDRIEALKEEKNVALQNLEVQKEIRDFEKNMSAKQKNASFAVDSKLLELQALEEERSQTNKNTERYKELTDQIAESTLHLKWFREEAEKLDLKLSNKTGRMYLGSENKDTFITGLTYTGLSRQKGTGSNTDYKDSIEFSKRLQAERLKEFQYHSKVVDEVKEEKQERQKITDMWRIAGMNDREAELTLEVQKTNAQLKNRKNLTKEQFKALQEYYDSLKKTIETENKLGKTNLSFRQSGYIDTKVGYEEFLANQGQYATNKYLRTALSSPGVSLSSIVNSKPPIENYRLATESTLQNIQKILMQGVKVKLLGKGYKLNYNKYYGGLNPWLNPDADANDSVLKFTKNRKAKNNDKKYKSYKDYNKLISKANTEEEKDKIRQEALNNIGYFAINKNGNIVKLSGKKNKNRTNQEIIDATKQYIEIQKLAIKVEDIFAEKINNSSKAVEKKAKYTKKSKSSSNKKSKKVATDIPNAEQILEIVQNAAMTANNLAERVEQVETGYVKEAEQATKAEQESGKVSAQVEDKKQKDQKETRKEIDYTKASTDELIETYQKANRTLGNKKLKQENRDYWTKVRENSKKELEKRSAFEISTAKKSPDTKESDDLILARDYSSFDLKNSKYYKKYAEKAIANNKNVAAWKTVLPIIEQRITDLTKAATDYVEQFNSEVEFVKDVLRKNDIKFDDNLDVKENFNKETGEHSYNFKNKFGSGNIFLGDDGQWHVKGVKTLQTMSTEAQKLSKELNKIDNYKFQYLTNANPEMFGNSEEIRQAQSTLRKLQEIRDDGFYGSEDELQALRNLFAEVDRIATSIKGGFKVGESELLGNIDPTRLGSVRQELVRLAKATTSGAIEIENYNAKTSELVYTVRTADDMLQTYSISMNRANGEIHKTLTAETEYISGFRKAISALGNKFGELFRYTIASVSMYDAIRVIRQGITVVKDMDTAMTELRKVSNDTEAALQSFRKESYRIAETIASTGKEIVNSAADWQKLGYTIEEASELAKNSALYANVGDMEIDVATEHMVSTLKAFNIEVKDSIKIVDKANEVGNNYAITSAGIGEALERSASSLVAAGNDIDQSIALITAGNIVTQDPESVGNAIKVLSLRVRGSKTELEEMGEETDNLAESTSKLRSEIKALTGVDIMSGENEYKSTYEILLEISKVWDSLSDVSQANVLEKLAGKTRASVVAGLLQNGETMEKVYQDSVNSAGSALKENERYMQSIQGHLDLLTNKWQEMWDSAINAEVVNFFLDLGTGTLELVNNVGLLESAIVAVSTALGAFMSYKNVGINMLVAY